MARAPKGGQATFRMELHGAAELEQALIDLGKRLANATLRRALIKAGQPVVDDARARIKGRAPKLAPAIQVMSNLSRRHRRTRAKGAQRGRADVYLGYTAAKWGLAHLFEFGTGPRVQKRTGRSTGQIAAYPHLRPAWDAGKEQVLKDFGEALWAEIEKSAKRLAKRQAKALK